MTRIFLIIAIFIFNTSSHAKCIDGGIYCISNNSTLNINGQIILNFYGSSQKIIPELNKRCIIYLESANSKVELSIVETLIGAKGITQIILKPNSTLISATEYILKIDGLKDYESKPTRLNNLTHKWDPISFKINNIIDVFNPTFSKKPLEISKRLVYYGCGPEESVQFSVKGEDKSEMFVRTNVKNKITGETTSFILAINDSSISVGHGMCYGGFIFKDAIEFEVNFQLIDQSGNKSDISHNLIFTKPIEETFDKDFF